MLSKHIAVTLKKYLGLLKIVITDKVSMVFLASSNYAPFTFGNTLIIDILI